MFNLLVVVKKGTRIVITGGPGSGKSSLLRALGLQGYSCQKEAARRVILKKDNLNYTPWGDRQGFIRLVYEQLLIDLRETPEGLVFCDRSMLDCIAYAKEGKLSVPEYLLDFDPSVFYHRQAFILPPWPNIYRKEAARQQEFAEAVSLYRFITTTYIDYGFQLIEVPPLPMEGRVEYILERLPKHSGMF